MPCFMGTEKRDCDTQLALLYRGLVMCGCVCVGVCVWVFGCVSVGVCVCVRECVCGLKGLWLCMCVCSVLCVNATVGSLCNNLKPPNHP